MRRPLADVAYGGFLLITINRHSNVINKMSILSGMVVVLSAVIFSTLWFRGKITLSYNVMTFVCKFC